MLIIVFKKHLQIEKKRYIKTSIEIIVKGLQKLVPNINHVTKKFIVPF